jgi:hypothetical protein
MQIAVDVHPQWTIACEFFDDDTFICSEDAGNLISCHKDSGSTKEHERNILKELGFCHLGEIINVFRHGKESFFFAIEIRKTIFFLQVVSSLNKQLNRVFQLNLAR